MILEISQKDEVLNVVNQITSLCIKRVKSTIIKKKQITSIVWELIDRILNGKVGRVIEKFRSDFLTRKNDKNFRIEVKFLGIKKGK